MVQNMDDNLNGAWGERRCFRPGFGRVEERVAAGHFYWKMSLKIR